ncbi:sugar transferase [Salsuginibacillus kocurii]|uniref:sugar transferase n=1 Tax=Salsuginibacillus kocurii TaxID=427078 RepID=UPI000368591B|nr:sugar transferase [Salsuginibacillus kocurii]
MFKRGFDLFIAVSMLMLTSSIIILASTLIFLRMGRPIFFKQKRPGYKGRPFFVYKFRTMTNETDENGDLLSNEERLTKIGSLLRKTSIDELPQLFNVIKGELSLVGPRPLLMEYLPLYTEEQARRHEVKPGITGWAQVHGRNNITWEEKFELDVWYVDNRSFILDMKIILLTIQKVVSSKDIDQGNKVGASRFKGSTK